MKTKKLFFLLLIPVFLLILYAIFSSGSDDQTALKTVVRRGEFQVKIYSSGQIESENKQDIPVPEKLSDRNLQIWSLKITELVEEGTAVDSGDFVARLDPEAVQVQIRKVQDEMDKLYSEYQDAKIDSNLNLSNQRDAITNARLDVEERSIIVKESIYESPSIQKKAQMDLDKATRKLEQEKNAYLLKKQQEENKVNRQFINYRQQKERYEGLEGLFNSLTIYSPKPGIVTYIKNPWGITKVGSEVGANGAVATIPDMTNLISRTYINEVDISKVKEGQKVEIGIDAFPNKKMKGEIVSIANIGQTMPNSDAKVFEVKIKVFGADRDLKPAMTTSNVIFGNHYADTLSIPADAVFENDSMQFVYLGNGNTVRQVVKLGESNEDYVLVVKGLKEGDVVYMNEPANPGDFALQGLDIFEEIKKEKEAMRKQAEAGQLPAPATAQPAGISGGAINHN